MRPFKMFFGIAVAVIVFSFVIRVAFAAFVIAAIMSIIYAVFRRLKDFVTYDRYGEPYIARREYHRPQLQRQWNEVEPLFYDNQPQHRQPIKETRFIETY